MFHRLQPEGLEQTLVTVAEIEHARLQELTPLEEAVSLIGIALPEGLEYVVSKLVNP